MSYKNFVCSLITAVSTVCVVNAYALSNDNGYEKAATEQFNTSAKAPCITDFPCFTISNKYPDHPPASVATFPWSGIDYKTEPQKYMAAVLSYVVEGNTEVDWQLQKNTVRPWYHAPWMHDKREPVHGLTMERRSRFHELGPNQTRRANNWAVGFYNEFGASTFGKVWADSARPVTTNTIFPIGTVTAKLLFTDATDIEAPYLTGNNLVWKADIDGNGQPKAVRLLQMDIAVKEKGDDTHSGWVFGTFVFNGDRKAANYWNNLIPVGLEWGNSPNLTYADYQAGKRPEESWINPEAKAMFVKRAPDDQMGYLGRMNGPVDSPLSSCMSCHGRAMDTRGERAPEFNPSYPDSCLRAVAVEGSGNETYERVAGCKVNEAAVAPFYRNLRSDEPFTPGFNSLDYSLQMMIGVSSWRTWTQKNYPTVSIDESASPKIKGTGIEITAPVKSALPQAETTLNRGN